MIAEVDTFFDTKKRPVVPGCSALASAIDVRPAGWPFSFVWPRSARENASASSAVTAVESLLLRTVALTTDRASCAP